MTTYMTVAGVVLCAAAAGDAMIDLADPKYRDLWLSHPVVGDPSYDAFERHAGNPIYQGAPPYEWPVNGSLFRDPRSGRLYAYVSLYPKGYWPAGPTRLLRSADDGGATWEDLGLVLEGDRDAFDGDGTAAGATCDATVVADEDGYHMAYGWAKPDNSDGGIAYAFAQSPEGPFVRDPEPIHAESAQPLIPPGYKRVYASALVRRANDWLILASMSTPGNAGGMWALIVMTAPEARGPYTPPGFLRAPQQPHWQPQPIEFFPAFVHEGFVYAPLTSVAANRNYQLIYRALLERAHEPDAWAAWQAGSLFHAEPNAWEAHGIWGQTFAGLVERDGVFRILYPSRDQAGVGTINLAQRPWDQPYRSGFWISAPNGPALALVLRRYAVFRLETSFRTDGDWRLVWCFNGPLGPDRAAAGATISELTWRDMACVEVAGASWRVRTCGHDGASEILADGEVTDRVSQQTVALVQEGKRAELHWNGHRLYYGALAAAGGGVGLVAKKGACIHVDRFAIDGAGDRASWFLLPTEGLLGAGSRERDWSPCTEGSLWHAGLVGDFDGARAKWSFRGGRARLWAPTGPELGVAEVFLDGTSRGRADFRTEGRQQSKPVWDSGQLADGRHALTVVRVRGAIPVDALEFFP